MKKRVCIFCGAKEGNSPEIKAQALQLCNLLIDAGYDLVYGGGKFGLMGLVADQFLDRDREVIGIRPDFLIQDEDENTDLTQIIVVDSMQERKMKMVELSDIFIALPGGVGTLDEIVETFTLSKIGFINKKSGVLSTNGYYDRLFDMLGTMVDYGFLTEEAKEGLFVGDRPEVLLRNMGVM